MDGSQTVGTILPRLQRIAPRGDAKGKTALALIILSLLAAAVVAYGMHPFWMHLPHPHGLGIILWSRRLQWVLVAVSLIGCILLIALAITGRRRAWWLIGLLPILALFAHRFTTGPAAARMVVVENPRFISVPEAKIAADEWVVVVNFDEKYYVYRYSTLFAAPVILQADHEKRIIVMWSAYANRVVALPIDQSLKAHDLEVISTPANALLLYNSRNGEFINALTGQTTNHTKPAGFGHGPLLLTEKMPWKEWQGLHRWNEFPELRNNTLVLDRIGPAVAQGPTAPCDPIWPMPQMRLDKSANSRIAVAGLVQPVMMESGPLPDAVENFRIDDVPVVMIQEPDHPPRVFDRRISDGKNTLVPVQLAVNEVIVVTEPPPAPHSHRHVIQHVTRPSAPRVKGAFVDINSNTGWNADGACVDARDIAYARNKKLSPMAVDTDLPLGVMKFWYADLAPPVVIVTKVDVPTPAESPRRRRGR